jgi:hypothetical protein
VACPGCDRLIPLAAGELGITVECSQCETRFTVGWETAPGPDVEAPEERPAEETPGPEAVGTATWMCAVISLGAGVSSALTLFLSCVPFLAMPVGAFGAVLGIVALVARNPRCRGMAIAGIVLNTLVVAVSLVEYLQFKKWQAERPSLPSLFDLDNGPRPKLAPGGGLTDDQKVAWEKLRNRRRAAGAIFGVAGYITRKERWQMMAIDAKAEYLTRWVDGLGTGFGEMDDSQGPMSWAPGLASQPDVKLTAIVDLFTEKEPRIVSWFYDDGKGPKRYKQSPLSGMDSSLRKHLLMLQAGASEL